MKNILLVLTISLTAAFATAQTVDTPKSNCTPEKAMKQVYSLLKNFEEGKQITELYSNITSRANMQSDGSYAFKFTYNTNKMKKVATASVNATTCKLEDYEGSSVWEIDTDGNEK